MATPDRDANIIRIPQQETTNHAGLAHLVEGLAARVAALEADGAMLRASLRALSMEVEVMSEAAKSRLGQARNVEQRCKQTLERMRALLARA